MINNSDPELAILRAIVVQMAQSVQHLAETTNKSIQQSAETTNKSIQHLVEIVIDHKEDTKQQFAETKQQITETKQQITENFNQQITETKQQLTEDFNQKIHNLRKELLNKDPSVATPPVSTPFIISHSTNGAISINGKVYFEAPLQENISPTVTQTLQQEESPVMSTPPPVAVIPVTPPTQESNIQIQHRIPHNKSIIPKTLPQYKSYSQQDLKDFDFESGTTTFFEAYTKLHFPELYKKMKADDPNFNPGYISLLQVVGGSPIPVYTKNTNIITLTKGRVPLTQTYYDNLSQQQKKNQIYSKKAASQLLFIEDSQINVKKNSLKNKIQPCLKHTEPLYTTGPERKKIEIIGNTLKAFGLNNFTVSPEYQNKIKGSDIVYFENLPVYTSETDMLMVNHNIMFGLLATTVDFTLCTTHINSTLEESLDVLRKNIIKGARMMSPIIAAEAHPDTLLQTWSLILYYDVYHNDKLITKSITMISAYAADFIADISSMDFAYNYTDAIQMVGSDVDYNKFDDYIINIDRFTIRVFHPVRFGGVLSEESLNWLNQFIKKDISGKSYYACDIGWAKIKTWNTSKNGCFAKLLHMELSKIRKLEANKYTTFWQNYDKATNRNTYQNVLTIAEASDFADYYQIHLIVYNIDKEIDNETHKFDKAKHTNSLNVLLYNNHYFLITEIRDIEKIKNIEPPNEYIKSYQATQLLGYYDLETVHKFQLGMDTTLLPYACDYQIWDVSGDVSGDEGISKKLKSNTVITEIPKLNLLQSFISDCVRIGCTILNKSKTIKEEVRDKYGKLQTIVKYPFVQVTAIAYNGSGFDHWLLFNHLMEEGYKCIQAPTGNRMYNFKFCLFTKNNKSIYLNVWDPYLFFRNSLANVAKSFKLEDKKGVYNHNDIQQAYTQDKLGEYLTQNSVKEYVANDTNLLQQITEKLIEVCSEICGINDPYNHCTLPAMAWKILNDIHCSPERN